MHYTLTHGDLCKADVDYIVHQVNCKGIMGGGVALAVKCIFPSVYKEYVALCNKYTENTSLLLGTLLIVPISDTRNIVNMFTQDEIGWNTQNTDLGALDRALTKLNYIAKGKSVAFPWRVGCVRGGASWDVVLPLITSKLTDVKELRFYALNE